KHDPEPAHGAVGEGPFKTGELHDADGESRKRRECVHLNCRTRGEQRSESHGFALCVLPIQHPGPVVPEIISAPLQQRSPPASCPANAATASATRGRESYQVRKLRREWNSVASRTRRRLEIARTRARDRKMCRSDLRQGPLT